jgi:hypothetical protein
MLRNSFTMLHAIWSDVATTFFLLFFFSATVAHLTPTVDLTALRPSGGPRPSGRPGASNAQEKYIYKMSTSTGNTSFSCFQFSFFITSSYFFYIGCYFSFPYGGGSVRVMFVHDRENPACAIDSVIITRSSQTSVCRDSSTLFYVQPAPTGRRPRVGLWPRTVCMRAGMARELPRRSGGQPSSSHESRN